MGKKIHSILRSLLFWDVTQCCLAVITNYHCVTPHKGEYINYSAVEASNLPRVIFLLNFSSKHFSLCPVFKRLCFR